MIEEGTGVEDGTRARIEMPTRTRADDIERSRGDDVDALGACEW